MCHSGNGGEFGSALIKKVLKFSGKVRRWLKLSFARLWERVRKFLDKPRSSPLMALISLVVAFFSLVVAIVSLAVSLVGPGSGDGAVVSAPPDKSVCTYKLGSDRVEAYDRPFAMNATFNQPIDLQVRELKSIVTVGPVLDFDAQMVDPWRLRGVTIQLRENNKVVKSASLDVTRTKSGPAVFNFDKEVRVDHSKIYSIVVINTTGGDIAIWVNRKGPTEGYAKVFQDGGIIDGSLSGLVCGYR